jgi:hypothetical protein
MRKPRLALGDLGERALQVGAGEGPVEWSGDLAVVLASFPTVRLNFRTTVLVAAAAMAHRAPAAPSLVDSPAATVAADLTANHPAGRRPEQAAAAAPWHHVHDLPRVQEGRARASGTRPIPRVGRSAGPW